MARPEVTGSKTAAKPERRQDANRVRGPPLIDEVDAFSIAEFCRRHGISIAFFYKFKHEMPATIRLGTRVLISREAAETWRRERSSSAA